MVPGMAVPVRQQQQQMGMSSLQLQQTSNSSSSYSDCSSNIISIISSSSSNQCSNAEPTVASTSESEGRSPSKLMSCSSSHFHCIGVRIVIRHSAVRLLSPTAPFVGFFSTPVFIYQKLLCDLFALKLKEVLNFKLCNAF